VTIAAKALRAFLRRSPDCALVRIVVALGSTPREEGAWMLVSPDAQFGTIGGGQLEFMAIDRARHLLDASSHAPATLPETVALHIPLGPEIGQCCGGRVEVSIERADGETQDRLVALAEADDAARPHVYIFGGGHVGQALARAFALLPLRSIVLETRADALDGMPDEVETRLIAMPEDAVRGAPPGSAYVVLTHDHALDFIIVAEALKRSDAAYVGMIGSKTKKATFRSWYLSEGGGSDAAFSRLVSPIGGSGVADKRPAIIAALAAAEIMTALAKVKMSNSS